MASECSEAECDREPLVKNRNSSGVDMTTEEMRKLLERNEVMNPNGPNLKPFDTSNV